jgi:small subunit ribosomal protein S11
VEDKDPFVELAKRWMMRAGGDFVFFQKADALGPPEVNFSPHIHVRHDRYFHQSSPSGPSPIESYTCNMESLMAIRAFRSICTSCRSSLNPSRFFSSSTRALAGFPAKKPTADVGNLFNRVADSSQYGSIIPGATGEFKNISQQEWEPDQRHHIHIYAHKHNTHITLTKPNRDALISVSCGDLDFKKAGRGTYDAAYQLAAFVMSRIQDKGLLRDITSIELVYRGFGPGREAVTKAILGSEGKNIRHLVTKLSDSTRLKFGGTRSKKPRRLG